MKKLFLGLCVALTLIALTPSLSQAKVERQPGGIPAFFIGCCWGIRVGAEWNEGADLHWREWCKLIPYANIVFAIWDGVDCYNGMTAHEWAEKNAANWY